MGGDHLRDLGVDRRTVQIMEKQCECGLDSAGSG
jgi:hypothetical protein